MPLPLLIFSCVGYLIFGGVSAAREVKREGRAADGSPHPIWKFIFGAGVPVAVAAVMVHMFWVVGFATTVQFNAGSPERMSAWSTWVNLWPLLLFLTAASALGTLIWFVFCAFGRGKRSSLVASIAAFCLSGLAFFTVASRFPTA